MHNHHLPKHSYPLHIKLILLLITGTFIWVMGWLFLVEIKHIKKLHHKIALAERYFADHNYPKAAQKFHKLARQYQSFDHAHKRLVQSCFAQSTDQPELFYYAMSYLSNRPEKTYTDAQLKELIAYVPDQYHDDFNTSLRRA